MNGDTQLAKLMHDFFCADPDKMYYPVLAKAARHFKKDEEGMREMYSEIERLERVGEERGRKEGRKEGREAGRKEGRLEERKRSMEEKRNVAAMLLAMGKLTEEEAAQVFGLGLDEVRAIAAGQGKG